MERRKEGRQEGGGKKRKKKARRRKEGSRGRGMGRMEGGRAGIRWEAHVIQIFHAPTYSTLHLEPILSC